MGTISLGLGSERPAGDPAYRLQVGSVIGRTFSVWLTNFVPFSLVGLVAYSPVLALIALLGGLGAMTPLGERFLDLLANFLTILLSGAVTYGVFRDLHGERAPVGEVLSVGLSRFGAVWVTGILYGLAVGIGLILLVIPGIVMAVRYWVAVPVAVIEDSGGRASLDRSRDLTEGNRWAVVRVILVLGFLLILGTVVLGLVAVAVGSAFGAPDTVQGVTAATAPMIQALVLVFTIPLQTLVAVAPVVAYHDLRVGKEGADLADLLKVFA